MKSNQMSCPVPLVTLEPMLSLPQLLKKNLQIPKYQRSYSWRSSHVRDLLKDTFGRSTPYLIGTVILHQKENKGDASQMDIVDGQQRLVTLTILLNELNREMSLPLLLQGEFPVASAKVIRNTCKVIRNFLSGKTNEEKNQYLKRLLAEKSETEVCLLFSVLTLQGDNALDEAYTFFDSVNSKGKALTDYDLLKAHHLMFIPPNQETLARSHNDTWQSRDDKHNQVFSLILRRLRMWAKNLDRDSKQERPDYNEFCSVVEPEYEVEREHMFNRYMQPVAFRSWRRMGDKVVLSMDYPVLDGEALIPTEVTQTIEGGDPFFLYAKRYHGLYETLFFEDSEGAARLSTAVAFVRGIAKHMDNLYLQNAFRAVMLLYVDKFGEDRLIEIGVCLERIISARRWDAQSLRVEGLLTHVKEKQLVPILLNTVNSLHSYTQLLAVAQTLPAIPNDLKKGVTYRYFNSIKQFYVQEKSKIYDNRALAIANMYIDKPIDRSY